MDNTEDIPKIGLCGFKNMGNTCYMNSVLQLLIHNKALISFLIANNDPFNNENVYTEFENYLHEGALNWIGNKERKRLNLKLEDKISINKEDVNNFISNSITIKLSEIINRIIYKGTMEIEPRNFKQIIDMKLITFKGFHQHDAHELLLQILDQIIEETGIETEPIISNIPDSIKEYIEYFKKTKEEILSTESPEEKIRLTRKFNEYRKNNSNLINKYNGLNYMVKIFKSKYNPLIYRMKTFLINIITCTNCKNQNCNFEDTTILSIPVRSTLEECLDGLIQEEIIEEYKCLSCNNINNATKKTNIWKPGMIIYIHLKRFKVLSNNRIQKDGTTVELPQEIDITRFCDPIMLNEFDTTLKYKLRGISNHYGGMGGGHYTADCISNIDNNWYNFDDSRVSKYDGKNLDTSSAYILMYEQI